MFVDLFLAHVSAFSHEIPALFGALLLGYAAGSIPFGLILTRLFTGQDVRQVGSGNIGATNVLRTGKKWLAALTLLLDALKGYLPLYWALGSFQQSGTLDVLDAHGASLTFGVALGAMLGHIYPLWLGFKGGKGVATILGLMLAYCWPMGVAVFLLWLVFAWITRISSLAALLAVAGFLMLNGLIFGLPVLQEFLSDHVLSESAVIPIISNQLPLFTVSYLLWSLLAAMLVVIKHKENIERLRTGREPKIGQQDRTSRPPQSAAK